MWCEYPFILGQENKVDAIPAQTAHTFRPHGGTEVIKIFSPIREVNGIKINVQRPKAL